MKQPENIMIQTIPEHELWENLKISNDFIFAKVAIRKDSKSIRLDVYLKDGKGTVYHVEIQTTDSRNLPKRTRYYQGRYTFRNVCVEEPGLELNDGTTKIFYNTKGTTGRIRWDAKKILNYMESNAPEDDFTNKLAREVQKVKENKEWKVEYMTLLMREREKFIEGKAEGKAGGIIDTLLDLGYNNDRILDTLEKKLHISRTQAENYLKSFYEGTL